jgi:transcriptional regulator with XRE-family HTH domain
MSKLGERIRSARRELGLTGAQLGYRTNISAHTVTAIERGECGSMSSIDPIIEYLENQGKPIVFNDDAIDLYYLSLDAKVLIKALVSVLLRRE